MNRAVYITTSWDDGHPCDARVAELLHKHGLRGTFYVPRSFAAMPMISPRAYEAFGPGVEVGAHTMDHVVLTRADEATTRREITDSKAWIEDQIGRACPMFCPPCGKFRAVHLRQCEDAGYAGVRTVEGWSLDTPRRFGRLAVLPTSVQALTSPASNHLRNVVKRRSFVGLTHWLRFGRCGSWEASAQQLLAHVSRRGGVLHLWGHSWEVDEYDQWETLDRVLAVLGRCCQEGPGVALTNGQLVERFASPAGAATQSSPPPSAPSPGDRTPQRPVLAGGVNWVSCPDLIQANRAECPPVPPTSAETSAVRLPFLAHTWGLGRSLRRVLAHRLSLGCPVIPPRVGFPAVVRRSSRVPRPRR